MAGPGAHAGIVTGSPDVAGWVAVAESPTSTPAATAEALTALLAADPRLGAATVLGILSLGPRYRPSRGLLVDPHDDADRRWQRRVAAARVLLASPAAALVAAELADELADSPELAAAVAEPGDHDVPAAPRRSPAAETS